MSIMPILVTLGVLSLITISLIIHSVVLRRPRYVTFAYSNVFSAILLLGVAMYLYDSIDTLVLIPGIAAFCSLILALLCFLMKRPIVLPTSMTLLQKVSELDDIHVVDTPLVSLSETQDILGTLLFEGKHKILFLKGTLPSEFFDIRTGMAGEVVQKLENYNIKAAIILDPSTPQTDHFQAFMRESTRMKRVFFASDETTARQLLG